MGIKRLDDFNHEVEVTKEVLSSMPINNAKNVASYKSKVAELKTEYSNYRDQLFREIKVRSEKYFSMKPNSRIETINKELEDYKDLYLCNPVNTPYEKMGLDILLYNLTHFYKNDLESVNNDIKEIFSKFKLVGIELSANDFVYSPYAKKYISELLKDDNIERMKDIFEDLHWKCPDVIVHIEVNFRILFNKNIKMFESYIENAINNILVDGVTYEDLKLKVANLRKELIHLNNYDDASIINKFMAGELTLNDYSLVNINKCYSKFLGDNVDMNAAMNKLDDFENLLYNLDEFKNYLRSASLIKDAKEKYADRDKHIGECAKINKEINTLADEINKLTETINNGSEKKFLFFKKKVDTEQYAVTLNEKVKELSNKYEEYDNSYIYEAMSKLLDETSSLFDLLNFLVSYKGYLRNVLKNSEEDNDIKRIKYMIKLYCDYVDNPNVNVLKNVKFCSDTDVAMLIVDHYKMLNIDIDKDMLNLDNIDELIKLVNIIVYNSYLNKCGMNIDVILSLFESKRLIETYGETI
ncbi:MAG: hypothetical protein ACI4WW_07860 [Candidatus Coprovivens sp.]